MAITIISYPNNNIDLSIEEATSLNSAEMVQNLWVDVADAGTDEYIEIVFNGVTTTLLITDECRYTPYDIAFKNKDGALQIVTMFKAVKEELSTTKEEFESDRGQPSEGKHQFVKYNVQGREKFKINSGFVKETMNETFKQLLLSESCWHLLNGKYIPLSIVSSGLQYKTRAEDRLINYELEFDYAYNEINNI